MPALGEALPAQVCSVKAQVAIQEEDSAVSIEGSADQKAFRIAEALCIAEALSISKAPPIAEALRIPEAVGFAEAPFLSTTLAVSPQALGITPETLHPSEALGVQEALRVCIVGASPTEAARGAASICSSSIGLQALKVPVTEATRAVEVALETPLPLYGTLFAETELQG